MNPSKLNFIVIDDSKLDCFIAEKIIRNTGRSESIKSFLHATDALEFIKNNTQDTSEFKTILMVDIQMPIMNGFDFVEAFDKLANVNRENFIIYVLSSSINENDLNRVRYLSSVIQFLNKPLTSNTLSALLDMIN